MSDFTIPASGTAQFGIKLTDASGNDVTATAAVDTAPAWTSDNAELTVDAASGAATASANLTEGINLTVTVTADGTDLTDTKTVDITGGPAAAVEIVEQ